MGTTIAFLGTGLMGAPMATRLVRAGFRTQVWNRSGEKAAALKQAGAIVCTSPAEAAADASFVCLCLTDAAAVATVTLLEHVDSLYRRLLDAGLGSEDLPALMRLYRDKKIRPC